MLQAVDKHLMAERKDENGDQTDDLQDLPEGIPRRLVALGILIAVKHSLFSDAAKTQCRRLSI